MEEEPLYLVDRMHLLHAGRQERPVEIEVHVSWRRVGDTRRPDCQWFWHNYATRMTRRACRADPDALFEILRRCLPFAEWDSVEYGTHEFSHRMYELGRVQGEFEDARAAQEWWSRAYDRLGYGGRLEARLEEQVRDAVFALPSRCAETNMRGMLRELMLREDGVARSRNRRWWFVVHRRVPAAGA